MGAPSKEEIAEQVECSRVDIATGSDDGRDHVIVALAEEVERLRAERIEVLALLEALHRKAMDPMNSVDAGRVIDAQRVEELCEDMIAKLRGAP